jgi:hypothetical protein
MAKSNAAPGAGIKNEIILLPLEVRGVLVEPPYKDGLLSAATSLSPVDVIIPWNTSFARNDLIRLLWNDVRQPATEYKITRADITAAVPLTLKLPLAVDDSYETGPVAPGRLSYHMEGDISGEITRWVDDYELYVDRTAPGGGLLGELELPNVSGDYVINPAELDPVKGLWTLVPTYGGQYEGDTLVPLISVSDDSSGNPVWIELSGSSVRLPPGASEQNKVELYFPLADLIAQGDGARKLSYHITDRAGNRSTVNGEPRPVTLLLKDVPTDPDLLAPVIPKYADLVIDEADARQLVVNIPRFDHANNGDDVELFWGTVSLGTRGISDSTADPILAIPVTYQQVIDGGNGSTRYRIDVRYTVSRSGHLMASSPVLPQVFIDITLPGGPDIDPLTPESEVLPEPWIIAEGGTQHNIIHAHEYGKDAKITVPWPPAPADVLWLQNDTIVIHYGPTYTLADYPLLPADVTNKRNLEFTLPGADMASQGTGVKKLWYTIARTFQPAGSLPGYTNTAQSKVVDVDVIGADEVPGGGTALPGGDWVTLTARGALVYANTRGGAEYEIELNYVNAAEGDVIHLHLEGHYDDTPTVHPGTVRDFTSDPLTRDDFLRGVYRFRVPEAYFTLAILPRPHYLDHSHYIVNLAGGRGNTAPLLPDDYTPVDLQQPTSAAKPTASNAFSTSALDDSSYSQLKALTKPGR